jgi:hypothetical protein
MNGAKIRADKDGRLICRRLGPSSEMKEAPTGLLIFARPTLPPLLCRFWSAALWPSSSLSTPRLVLDQWPQMPSVNQYPGFGYSRQPRRQQAGAR